MTANLTNPNVLTPKEEIAGTVCDRLLGGETLSEICRDPAMPDKLGMMRWLAQDPTFLEDFVFTYQLLAEVLAAQAVRVADTRCRRLRLAVRRWVADRLIRKIVSQSESYETEKEVSCIK